MMGGILGYFFGGSTGRTDDPDPKTGLTSRDKYNLTTTWAKVTEGKANLETGMALFLNLFKMKPQYHQLFPFRDTPLEKLKDTNKFKAHCVSLMYAFTSIMHNIDNPDMLEQLAAKQGTAHIPRKVPDVAYTDLKKVLMALFKDAGFTQDQLNSWDKFLDVFIKIMVINAEKGRKELSS